MPDSSSLRYLFLRAALLFVSTLAFATSCDHFPRDTRGALNRILEQGELHIGVFHHPPWTFIDPDSPDKPRGVEVALVSEFAGRLGARPVWHIGSESQHFVSLENHDLDLVIGGIESATPWRPRLGLTLGYYLEEADVGISSASGLPDSLDGVTVYYRYGSAYRNGLEDQGAIPAPLNHQLPERTPLAAPLWHLRAMNLTPLGIKLPAKQRVMAVPPGEHALLMRLERFLLNNANKGRVEGLLGSEVAGP